MKSRRLFYSVSLACLFGGALTSKAQTCPSVTNLTLTQLSTSSASVSATPAAGATSYIIICTIYPAGAGIVFSSLSVATPAYTFTGIPANTPFSICINTPCAAGQIQGSACTARTVLATHNAALAEQVTLSPNPAHAAATLTLPAKLSTGARMSLVNTLSQVVRQRTLPTGSTAEVDLAGLAAGIYTVQLQAGEEWVTKRLVVQ